MSNSGVAGKVVGGFAGSTRAIHEINKDNMAAVRADARANFEEATAPDPGLVKFKEAEGFGNKVKTIAENIREGAVANSEKERARRAEIQSHESYRMLLEEQREHRQATIARPHKP